MWLTQAKIGNQTNVAMERRLNMPFMDTLDGHAGKFAKVRCLKCVIEKLVVDAVVVRQDLVLR